MKGNGACAGPKHVNSEQRTGLQEIRPGKNDPCALGWTARKLLIACSPEQEFLQFSASVTISHVDA